MSEAISPTLTVRDLRRRWKPHKERLKGDERHQPTLVRVHRAFSWFARAESMDSSDSLDDQLILQWISFNTLYGQWNQQEREPGRDKFAWKRFLDRILELDTDQRIAALLTQHKRLVVALFDDAYLSNFFWQNPTEVQAARSRKVKFDSHTWYMEKRWGVILERVVDRIYLMRCQLIHGAATHGGRLNRKTLHRCTTMLSHLLNAILLTVIDHGAEQDWGPLCYPPINRAILTA